SLHNGAVVQRRRSDASNWSAFEEFPKSRLPIAGDHLRRVFDAHDFVRGLPNERALLDERLVLVEAHRLDQVGRFAGGEWQIEQALISLTDGIAFEGAVDSYALHVLARLDGSR